MCDEVKGGAFECKPSLKQSTDDFAPSQPFALNDSRLDLATANPKLSTARAAHSSIG
jgi:hypothetical protein